ncbi:MAG: cytidylyltransferase domain-containing protein [Candidatus Brocadiales bacterium]
MFILSTICARGGSKGLPQKNIRTLAGKPLIAHTIETALSCKRLNRVIVSTDDQEIAEISRQYGAEVPFLRPEELAGDNSSKWPVLQHAVKYLENKESTAVDIVVDLDPTSPLRKVSDIEECIDKLIDERPDAVITVYEAYKNPYFNMVEFRDGRAFLSKDAGRPITSRQDAPKVYSMNASVYAIWRDVLMSRDSLFTGNVKAVIMPPERSVDIDREIDFDFVEFLIKKYGQGSGKGTG